MHMYVLYTYVYIIQIYTNNVHHAILLWKSCIESRGFRPGWKRLPWLLLLVALPHRNSVGYLNTCGLLWNPKECRWKKIWPANISSTFQKLVFDVADIKKMWWPPTRSSTTTHTVPVTRSFVNVRNSTHFLKVNVLVDVLFFLSFSLAEHQKHSVVCNIRKNWDNIACCNIVISFKQNTLPQQTKNCMEHRGLQHDIYSHPLQERGLYSPFPNSPFLPGIGYQIIWYQIKNPVLSVIYIW